MRIFFATDLHGSNVCFKKFCAAADFYQCDALILGGDVTGKLLVPIVAQGDKIHYRLGGLEHDFPRTKLTSEIERISDMGYYPIVCEEDEARHLKDPAANGARLEAEAMRRARAWVDYAEAKLGGRDVPILFTLGNDDDPTVITAFEGSSVFVHGDQAVVDLDEVEVASFGWSNPTPWNTPRELPEDQLESGLRSVVERVKDPRRAFFNVHAPPSETNLDLCPQLTDDLRVVTVLGAPVQMHAGSTAVRTIIEEYQPLAGLHGHIHESRNLTKLGGTVSVNPGSEYSEGVLLGVIVDMKKKSKPKYTFTAG
jgi:hypothetical protein